MKHQFLFLFIFITTGIVFSQTNILSDGGFETDTYYGTNNLEVARIYTLTALGENTQTGNPTMNAESIVKNKWYRKCIANSGFFSSLLFDTDSQEGSKSLRLRIGNNYQTSENSFVKNWDANVLMQFIDLDKTKKYQIKFFAKNIMNCDSLYVGLIANAKIISGTKWVKGISNEWSEFTVEIDPSVNVVYTDTDFAKSAIVIGQTNTLNSEFKTAQAVEILVDNIRLFEVADASWEPAPDTGNLLHNGNFNALTSIPRKKIKGDDKFSKTLGEWYFYAETGLNGIDNSKGEIKQEGGNFDNVVSLSNGSPLPSWWGRKLAQRLAAKPGQNVYRISFYAKSNAQSEAAIFINTLNPQTGKEEFILVEGFNPTTSPNSSGARYGIKTSNEWKYYECTFDFSQKCNNYNSPNGVGAAYAITNTNDIDLSYCFLTFLNNTASSELLIDNIVIEEIATHTEIQNPGFENSDALPVQLSADLTLGAHSGRWVLVSKGVQDGSVSISNTEAKTGDKSMKVNAVDLTSTARYNFYLVMDIYEVPPMDYSLKFSTKADKADIPFRLDVLAYDGSTPQAIVGENGESLTTEGVTTSSAGLKIFKTDTEWVDYRQRLTIPENSVVRIIIRPNIEGLGSHGPAADSFPMNYWFDDFKLEEYSETSFKSTLNNNIFLNAENGQLKVSGLEKTDLAVYNLSGVKVRETLNATGEMFYSLPRGVYIVKFSEQQPVKILIH